MIQRHAAALPQRERWPRPEPSVTASERQRRHREWVASGGPARAAAHRASLPASVRAAREAMIKRSVTPVTLRQVDAKLARMVDAKRDLAKKQAELRTRARALLWISDQKMLARARRRLASIRNRDREAAFELTGTVPDELR
jgi:hypothetical protein